MSLPASVDSFVSADHYMHRLRTNQINSVAPPTSPNKSKSVYVSLLVTFRVGDSDISIFTTGHYSGYLAQLNGSKRLNTSSVAVCSFAFPVLTI